MSVWKRYEKQIFDILRNKGPSCNFKKNDFLQGHFSGVKRQVDISIKGEIAGYEVVGVVECKCLNKKIDVKIVDSFVGFLEDVGATLGIIVTNKGYTNAAKNRAKIKGIKLDIVKFDEIDEYNFDIDICRVCDPGEDKPWPVINWGAPYGFGDEKAIRLVQFGRCDRCNSVHIKCQACGSITAIYESDYNSVVECEGGCGLKFKIVSDPFLIKDGGEEYIEIVEES